MKNKYVKCSARRFRKRCIFMSEICRLAAHSINEGNTFYGRVCLEALEELTRSGWPSKDVTISTLPKKAKR